MRKTLNRILELSNANKYESSQELYDALIDINNLVTQILTDNINE